MGGGRVQEEERSAVSGLWRGTIGAGRLIRRWTLGCRSERRRQRLEREAINLERSHLSEYIRYLQQPWRMIRVNLLAGLMRGFGTAIGFTILGAAVIYFLQQLAYQNLPLIGGFIAEIMRIVDLQRGGR